jgi:WD40 repeat protein
MNRKPTAELDSLFFTPDASAPDQFFGRAAELATVREWIAERVKICVIQGLGGSGKTELVRQALRTLRSERRVIWCSLRDSPDLEKLVSALVARHPTTLDRSLRDPLEKLVSFLTVRASVLVLDNFEAVLGPTTEPRHRASIAAYQSLPSLVAKVAHESTVILTTRVQPTLPSSVARGPDVRTLKLGGLDEEAALALLGDHNPEGSQAERVEFVRRYGGNPLALHLAAELVEDLFGNRLSTFLRSASTVMGGVAALLEAHLSNISPVQVDVLTRLATAREPMTFDAIVEGTLLTRDRSAAAGALQSLFRSSLVERRSEYFYLQYLIQEYVLARFAKSAAADLAANQPDAFGAFPLVDALRPIHIRDAQRRLTVPALRDALDSQLGGDRPIPDRLRRLLDTTRYGSPSYGSFVAANVLELARAVNENLSELTFANTRIRHVDFSDCTLHLVDMANCEFDNCRFAAAHEHVFDIALSSDGGLAALGHVGGSIVIIEVPSGRIVRTIDWDAVWLRAIAWSADDNLIAATDDRGRIRIVRLDTGATIDVPGNGRQIRSLTFSEDGQLLFAGGEEGLVRQIQPNNGSDVRVVVEAGSEVWSLACDHDVLAIATSAEGLRLVSLDSAAERPVEPAPAASGRSVAFSGSGDAVFVGCDDGDIRIWSRSGSTIGSIAGHTGPVWSVAVGQVGAAQTLFSGSHDGSVRAVDVTTPQSPELTGVLITDEGPVWPVVLDRRGTILATVAGSSIVRFWNPQRLEPLERLRGGFRRTFAVASNQDSTIVATGGQDSVVRLWNPVNERCLAELPGHRGGLRTLAFSPSGQLLASAGEDWDVRLWNTTHPDLRTVLEGPKNWVWSLAFDPSGEHVAAGSADLKVHIWELPGGFSSRRLSGHAARVVGLAYSADGRHLFSCAVDGECWLWDADSGRGTRVTTLDAGANCLAYLGDMRVAVGSRNGTVTIVDADAGTVTRTVTVQDDQVLCLCGVPTSGALYCGGENGTIVRINNTTYEVENSIVLGGEPVRSLAPLSRGAEIIAARGNETSRILTSDLRDPYRAIVIPRQYEGLRLHGARGLTRGQLDALVSLGAISDNLTFVEQQRHDNPPGARPAHGERPVTVFVSYSHEDTLHMEELRKHLTALETTGQVEVWVDRMIEPGADWDGEIDARLNSADIVLLLLSSDYLASAYCRKEMFQAMDRADQGQARLVPVIVRHCDWKHLPVARFQALPTGGTPIVASANLDEVRAHVTSGVRLIAAEVRAARSR